MSATLQEALSAAGVTTEAADYAKSGFHHRHTVAADGLVGMAQGFRNAGYFLEMLTAYAKGQELPNTVDWDRGY